MLTKREYEEIKSEIYTILTSDDEVTIFQKQFWDIKKLLKKYIKKVEGE